MFVVLIVKTTEPGTWPAPGQSGPGGYFEIAPVLANRRAGSEAPAPAPANQRGVMLRSRGPAPPTVSGLKMEPVSKRAPRGAGSS